MRSLRTLSRAALAAWALAGCVTAHGGAPAKSAAHADTTDTRAAAIATDDDAHAANAAPEAAPAAPAPPPAPRLELPRGGRAIFPEHRLVGFCGTPGAPALGRLMGDLSARAKTVRSYADKYSGNRKVLPLFELIAVVVQGVPGPDGKYRRRVADAVVDQYLAAAREAQALLLLNIQPGHSDFMTEVKHFERWLREPDVGVALDPEWAMKGKQKPGVFYGQATGAAIDEVADYLSGVVKTYDLPEKALVFHQVNAYVLKDEADLKPHAGVALVKSVDGLGPKGAKITTYHVLVKTMSPGVHAGFKLFFDEDLTNGGRLMTPSEVLALAPEPEYVMYE